jgi:hypothetical protein
VLLPLAPHPYRPVVLDAQRVTARPVPLPALVQVPHVVVERRSLQRYCELAAWSPASSEDLGGAHLLDAELVGEGLLAGERT